MTYFHVCGECGVSFESKYKTSKYCCRSCLSKHTWRVNRDKLSDMKKGALNPNWKGDDVGYVAIHGWVRRRKPKPEFCECCGEKPPRDLANISQEYLRDVNDFEWLCRKCHLVKDGRMGDVRLRAASMIRGPDGRYVGMDARGRESVRGFLLPYSKLKGER